MLEACNGFSPDRGRPSAVVEAYGTPKVAECELDGDFAISGDDC